MFNRDREGNRGQDAGDLRPLRSLSGWRVSEGDPDIRGWNVLDSDGNKIGQVQDLIINQRTGEALYVEIMYGGSLGIGAKHTAMPIGDLKIDQQNKQVVSNYPLETMKQAPDYHEGIRDFGPFSGFWAGLAAAGISRQAQPTEREGQPQGVVQRFVQRVEGRETQPGGEAAVPRERGAENVRRVRVHMAHRGKSGEETTLNEGDVLEIPVTRGETTARGTRMIDEIIIRLETVDEEEEEEEREHTTHYTR